MKKTLLIALLLTPFFSFSQAYIKHGEFYLNALLVNPPDYNPDYDNIRDIQVLKNIDSKWKDAAFKTMSYKKFIGDTLEVIKVEKSVNDLYPILSGYHLFLKSHKTNDLYGLNFISTLPFKVAKQITPITKDSFCSEIIYDKDKFTDATTFQSPKTGNDNFPGVYVSKVIKGNAKAYFITLRAWSTDAEGVLKTGVIILFDDDTKENFPDAEVDVKINESGSLGGFNYQSTIRIPDNKLSIFSSKKITGYRLYTTDTNLDNYVGSQIMYYFQCIQDKN